MNSCRDEFLESHPTETLANPPAQAKLYGLYLMMVNTETGGTTGHDDFGQKGYDIYMDLLSSDMVLGATTYGWFSSFAQLDTKDYTNLINYRPWRYYYRIVYAANDIIAGLGGNDAVLTKAEDKYAMAQAKAMRAYAYFYLTQLYTTRYEPTSSDNSIPLYIDASVTAKPKAQQSEVYTQMVKDLEEAIIGLEGYNRPNKGVINKDIAQGLLAYVYAAMGENAKASQVALNVINSGTYPLTSKEETVYMDHGSGVKSGGGFNDLKTRSWMWGFDITTDNNLDLISFWGQMDIFTYSYAWAGDPKLIDEGLYSSINDNDIRKEQFNYSYSGKSLLPANKFFDSKRTIRGQRKITSDYVFMRVDELYLLAAETLAKSGNEAEAKNKLKALVSLRMKDGDTSYIDTLSGSALQDEIYKQTRIELWGEGKSYLAMKRNKKSVTRGNNHIYYSGTTFNYDDERLTLKIPQGEVNNNPHITN